MPKFVYSARPAAGGDIKTGELEVKTKEEVQAFLHPLSQGGEPSLPL